MSIRLRKWLLAAAKHGELEAQVHLGLMYVDDRAAKKDIKSAEIWLRAAALRDSEEAKIALEKNSWCKNV